MNKKHIVQMFICSLENSKIKRAEFLVKMKILLRYIKLIHYICRKLICGIISAI